MLIGNIVVDPERISFEEANALVQGFRELRARKEKERSHFRSMHAIAENTKEDNMAFCNRYTGEVFNPKDWVVYDEVYKCTYDEVE